MMCSFSKKVANRRIFLLKIVNPGLFEWRAVKVTTNFRVTSLDQPRCSMGRIGIMIRLQTGKIS